MAYNDGASIILPDTLEICNYFSYEKVCVRTDNYLYYREKKRGREDAPQIGGRMVHTKFERKVKI